MDEIEVKIVFYFFKDGIKVLLFLVYKKGLKFDGNNLIVFYGYGGFNIGILFFFIGMWVMFINWGGVFVYVGLWGGDEYGE